MFRDGRGADAASCHRTTGRAASAGRRGPASLNPMALRASGTCTCSLPNNPTATGSTSTSEPNTRTPFASGSTEVPTGSASTSPTRCSRNPACPMSATSATRPTIRDRTRSGIPTACTRCIARGVASPTRTSRPVCSWPRRGYPDRSVWRATCGPTNCTPPSTSTTSDRHGGPITSVGSSRPHSSSMHSWARLPPGCCRTTTSFATCRASPASHQAHEAHQLLQLDGQVDMQLGQRRARAAIMLMAALPGSCYLYQGEELGLPEVEDLPPEVLQDPAWVRSGFTDPGRDGCRVPLPWSGASSPFGFGPEGSAARGCRSPCGSGSTRPRPSATRRCRCCRCIARRFTCDVPVGVGDGALAWVDAPDEVLWFTREPGFTCMVNFGASPLALPPTARAAEQRVARRRCCCPATRRCGSPTMADSADGEAGLEVEQL